MREKLKKLFSTLSMRFIIMVLPIVLIAFAWMAYKLSDLSTDAVFNLSRKTLKRDTAAIMRIVDNEFSNRYSDIKALSSNPILIGSLRYKSFKKIGKVFSQLKADYKVYSAIELYDVKGEILASSSRAMLRFLKNSSEANQARTTWFQKAMRGRIGHSDLEYSNTFSSRIISFYAPVVDPRSKKAIGVMRFVYSWKHIYKQIKNYEEYSADHERIIRSFFLVDQRSRKILYHADNTKVNQSFESIGFGLENVLSSGPIPQNKDYIVDVNYEISNYFENNLGWVCIGIQEKKSALNFLYKLKSSLSLMTGLTIVILLLVLSFLVRLTTKPITSLADSMHETARSGKFGGQLANHPILEIDNLIQAFNKLTQELQASDGKIRELAALPETNPGPVVKFSGSGAVELANKAASQVFQTELAQPDASLYSMIPEFDKEKLESMKGHQDALETDIVRNSNHYHLNCFFNPDLDSYFLYGTDVTERKRAHAQSMHAVKLASIGELAAGVGHEINNPLAVTSGNTFRIRTLLHEKGILDNEIEAALNKQDLANQRIRNIANGLRTFAREDSEEIEEELSLSAAVDQTVSLLSKIYEVEGVELLWTQPEVDYMVKGSFGKFQQIMMNLISNAKDATEGQKVRKIDLSLKQNGSDYIALVVQDNGKGIPEEIQDKIFQTFFSTKKAGKGTGMGLGITVKLVEELRGKINLESKVGWGSTFMLEFPLIEVTKLEKPEEKVSQQDMGEEMQLKGDVLVVDDELDIREILTWLFNGMGLTVEDAVDGVAALEKVKAKKYDYIFTDLTMPKMSGLEFIKSAKQLTDDKTKFFIISGGVTNDYVDEKDSSLYEIADGYLDKPFTKEVLYQAILKANKGTRAA